MPSEEEKLIRELSIAECSDLARDILRITDKDLDYAKEVQRELANIPTSSFWDVFYELEVILNERLSR